MISDAVLVVKTASRALDGAFQTGADRAAGGQSENVRRDAGCPGQLWVTSEGVRRVFGGRGGVVTRRGGDVAHELDRHVARLQPGILEHVADEGKVRSVDLRDNAFSP